MGEITAPDTSPRHRRPSLTHQVTDPAWWIAAGRRAAWTTLAAAASWAALVVTADVDPWYAIGVIAIATLASLVTSLAGLPEVDGRTVPLWQAILARVLRQAGQTASPVLLAVVGIADVDWPTLGRAVALAAFVTLLRTLMTRLEPIPSLPETTAPTPAAAHPDNSTTQE